MAGALDEAMSQGTDSATTAGLLDALATLQAAETVADIGAVIGTAIGPAIGALHAMALLLDERDRDVLRPAGEPPAALGARYERVSRRSKLFAVEAATGREVWIASSAELEAHQPRLAKTDLEGPGRAWAALPLVARADGRPLGALALWFAAPARFSDDQRAVLRAVAHHVGGALGRGVARDQLRQRVRFASDLTAAVLHDVRTPLNAIVLSADVLAQSSDAERPVRRLRNGAARISRVLDQASALISLCLDVPPPLSPRTIDLRAVLTRMVAELETAASVPVTLESVGDPVGTWDGERLPLALSSLLDVALARSSGPVRVAIDGTSPRSVEVSISHAGELPSALSAALALPVVGDWSPRMPGVALALHVARLIVRLHDGYLTAEKADAGIRFAMSLPRGARTA